MTTKDKVARRKLSLLELATDLDNVSKACKLMGYSRQQFYEIRRNFQTYGAEGLIDRLPGAKGPHPNRVPEEIEQAILDHALEHPSHGPLRVSHELMLQGIQVSSGGVRGVWSRPRSADQAPAPVALGDARLGHQDRPHRRADQVVGAVLARVPRTPYRDPLYRRPGGRGHLLHRSSQGRQQGLPADRHRLLLALRLGPALHFEAAGHRRARHEQRRAADLRGTWSQDHHRALG